MPQIPFADNFLAGSIISLLMPVGLLIAIAIWYVRAALRLRREAPGRLPGRERVPDVPPSTGGPEGGSPGSNG
jgi:hypothetical protein